MALHAAYVLAGGPKWPNGPKLTATPDGPTKRLYYEANDPAIDRAFFDELRRLGYSPGIGYDPKWTMYQHSPERYANMIADRRAELGGGPLLPDVEIHDADFVFTLLETLVRILPGVNLAWTLESMQGGWIVKKPELVALINDVPQLVVVPQFYTGAMRPYAADYATRDLVLAGIKPEKIRGFYPLRDENWKPIRIPTWWDGILYVENWTLLP